jgi:hypothetical protein
LAERALEEGWSCERFATILRGTEVTGRDSHSGEARIKAPSVPGPESKGPFGQAFLA